LIKNCLIQRNFIYGERRFNKKNHQKRTDE
jgi:hypothetical protein